MCVSVCACAGVYAHGCAGDGVGEENPRKVKVRKTRAGNGKLEDPKIICKSLF